MKRLLFIAPLALIALPAHAQSSRSTTVDRPNYQGSRTVTRDGQGNVSRGTSVVRKSDGAIASHSYNRARSDGGWSSSRASTGFRGHGVSRSRSVRRY